MEAGERDGGAGKEAATAAAGAVGGRVGWATNSSYWRVNPGRESGRVIAVSRFRSWLSV